MGEGAAILTPPDRVDLGPDVSTEAAAELDDANEVAGPEEVPSIFSCTNRYLVGRVDVSPPAADGSRVLRLYSRNAGTVVEANLSPQLCEFVSGRLVEVEVIEEVDAEVVEDDAGPGQ